MARTSRALRWSKKFTTNLAWKPWRQNLAKSSCYNLFMNDEVPLPLPQNRINVPAKQLPVPKDVKDFRDSMQWRIFRIMAEFVEGFEFIASYPKSVTIFGSTRDSHTTHTWYEEARKLGALLAQAGFAVVTGGG